MAVGTYSHPSGQGPTGDGGGQRGGWTSSFRARRRIRVAIVNNMTGRAFEVTHRQFADLFAASTARCLVDVRYFRLLPSSRSSPQRSLGLEFYEGVDNLYRDPPDALVVTGTEPMATDLTHEPYWGALAELVRWAEATVPSTLLSCLAAHAGLLALDGATRRPLATKRSGVFCQQVDESHCLGRGLGATVTFPHSRWNEVPGVVLRSLGYQVVVGTAARDWTVAARERAGRMLMLVQGHPEYERTTLLREFRRDLRRFASGSAPAPEIPANYLAPAGEDLLKEMRSSRDTGAPEHWYTLLPDLVAPHVVPHWSGSAERLIANWIADARQRALPRQPHDGEKRDST